MITKLLTSYSRPEPSRRDTSTSRSVYSIDACLLAALGDLGDLGACAAFSGEAEAIPRRSISEVLRLVGALTVDTEAGESCCRTGIVRTELSD